MKIWDKGIPLDKLVEKFTIGKDNELDLYLAEFDVLGSISHAKMLNHINLLNKEETSSIVSELLNILQKIKKGDFQIENGIEDIHSQIEYLLIQKLGDTGKKLHTGRSRNDQVLLDLKLYMRNEIIGLTTYIEKLFNQLISLSNQYKDVLMPGYTHMQVAMVSSFGLWFGSFAESLVDDIQFLLGAYKIINQNPLGSGAGFGSSFPIDRALTTKLLGFDQMNYNVIYAQMGRGKTERLVSYSIASIAYTLGKMAMDIGLFLSQNFNFISFPEKFTTGSSIMPHKQNPDVFELVRARANKLQALPNEITLITSNLPSGYHRDFQIIKETLIPAFNDVKTIIEIMALLLGNIIINNNILNDKKYQYLFSVEEVNKKVLAGIPFRDAYKEIAKKIKDGTYTSDNTINHIHEGSIGNLCNDKIKIKMNNTLKEFHFDKVESALTNLIKNK